MNAFEALHQTVLAEAPPLPPELNDIVILFGDAHMYFRSYRQKRIFAHAIKDPSNGNPLAYGTALHLASEYTAIGNYAMKLALITKCGVDLLKEYRSLNDAYVDFNNALRWQYPLYQHVDWKRKPESQSLFVSPSFYPWWQIDVVGLTEQIIKIVRCALSVLGKALELGFRLKETYLLLNHDRQTRFEACVEMAAEWDKYLALINEDKKRLYEEIAKGQVLADKILARMGSDDDDLSRKVLEGLNAQFNILAENAEDIVEDICNAGGRTLDAFYVPGSITQLHIDFDEGEDAPPLIPPGIVPPYGGQHIELEELPEIEAEQAPVHEQILVKAVEAAQPITEGISWLKSSTGKLYAQNPNKINREPSVNPFQ